MIDFLEELDDEGAQSASDYDDGRDGWFGWNVARGGEGVPVLTVYFRPNDSQGIEIQKSWRLVENVPDERFRAQHGD